MKILVVGSGAREHALCWRLAQDPGVTRVICAPGNAGIAREFTCIAADSSDPAAILALVEQERIDLTVVGPEVPLARGVVDLFSKQGRPIFGPRQAAARLETSKAFAKDFMQKHGVPTARYRTCDDVDEALAAIRRGEFGDSVVVKADGLAAGKGVVVAESRREAEDAIRVAMVEHAFGDAGRRIVIEERLEGPEVSFFVIADGEHAVPLVAAQDHKRIFDDDRGANTGGMGAFAPSPLVDEAMASRVMSEIVQPTLYGLILQGSPYRGVLYCGLMLTSEGPKVIEYNVRFGDPEAQVVLPMIAQPLTPLLWAAATGVLRSSSIAVSSEPHVGVVLASAGYPGEVQTGQPIEGFNQVEDALVFFAGVGERGGDLITSGGRVMTVVGRGPNFDSAIARAYAAVGQIRFEGMQFRRDIGRKLRR